MVRKNRKLSITLQDAFFRCKKHTRLLKFWKCPKLCIFKYLCIFLHCLSLSFFFHQRLLCVRFRMYFLFSSKKTLVPTVTLLFFYCNEYSIGCGAITFSFWQPVAFSISWYVREIATACSQHRLCNSGGGCRGGGWVQGEGACMKIFFLWWLMV